jgi:hypothetical protein
MKHILIVASLLLGHVIQAAPQAPVAQLHSATVTWTAPAGATGYNVWRLNGACPATLPSPTGFTKINAAPITVLTYTDNGFPLSPLPPGIYCYYVTAVYPSAESGPSNTVQGNVAPFAPPSVSCVPAAGQTTCTWTPSADALPVGTCGALPCVSGYNVYRGSGGCTTPLPTMAKLTTALVNGLTYTDTTTAPGVIYAYQVTSVSGTLEGALSACVQAGVIPLGAPTNVTIAVK